MFYNRSTILISRLPREKLQTNFISKKDTKTLNKMLTNKIQQYIKRTVHHDQIGFIP